MRFKRAKLQSKALTVGHRERNKIIMKKAVYSLEFTATSHAASCEVLSF